MSDRKRTSKLALTSLITALFTTIPLFFFRTNFFWAVGFVSCLVFPPITVITAMAALRQMRRPSSHLTGRRLARVVFGVGFLQLALAIFIIPGFLSVRRQVHWQHCISNLSFIDMAKRRYQMENKLPNGIVVSPGDLREYFGRDFDWQKDMVCYTAGSNAYVVGGLGEDPECPIHGTMGSRPVGSVNWLPAVLAYAAVVGLVLGPTLFFIARSTKPDLPVSPQKA